MAAMKRYFDVYSCETDLQFMIVEMQGETYEFATKTAIGIFTSGGRTEDEFFRQWVAPSVAHLLAGDDYISYHDEIDMEDEEAVEDAFSYMSLVMGGEIGGQVIYLPPLDRNGDIELRFFKHLIFALVDELHANETPEE